MKWHYEVRPVRVEGEVEASDEEDARHASTQDALAQAEDAIFAGTWEMRQVEDDGS